MDTVITRLTGAWTDLTALWAAADPSAAVRETITVQPSDCGAAAAVVIAQGRVAPPVAVGHLLRDGDRLELAGSPARRYFGRSYMGSGTIVATGAGIRSVAVSAAANPDFGTGNIADQAYTHGSAIADLVAPAATGGSGGLEYFLYPSIPGLTWTAGTRTLSGTPTSDAVGTHEMLYVVRDEAGADDALAFTVVVS